MLAGMVRLARPARPWLLQWHNDLDTDYDLRKGDYYRDFVRDEAQALGSTLEQVRAWGSPVRARGRRSTSRCGGA